MRYRAVRSRLHVGYWAAAAAVIVILGITIRPDHTVLVIGRVLVYVCLASMVFCTIRLLIYQRREYDAATDFLRTAITARNFPPSDPSSFAEWCRRHNVSHPDCT